MKIEESVIELFKNPINIIRDCKIKFSNAIFE